MKKITTILLIIQAIVDGVILIQEKIERVEIQAICRDTHVPAEDCTK